MNRLKIHKFSKEYLENYWDLFRLFNRKIHDKELLLESFRFIVLFIMFDGIIEEKQNNNCFNGSFKELINRVEYFNNNFCLCEADIVSDEKDSSLFYLENRNKTDNNRIVVIRSFLEELKTNILKKGKITDEFLSELHLLCLNINDEEMHKIKDLGIYYTPMTLAETISKASINQYLLKFDYNDIKVFDSSCGTGNFLVASFTFIYDYLKLKLNKFDNKGSNIAISIITDYLIGIDIDKWAIITCKLRFLLKILHLDPELDVFAFDFNHIFKNIVKADFLTFEGNFRPNIIVGNPPWGKIGLHDYKHKLAESFSYQGGQIDVYRLFIELLIELNPKILSLVTPDSWLEILGARKLKNIFLKKRMFKSIFILPERSFQVKTHFLGFISTIHETNDNSKTINVHYLNSKMDIVNTIERNLETEVLINQPVMKNLLLEASLVNFNKFLKCSKSFTKLGELIDATVGYQLYHNTIHTSREIQEKVYHSKVKNNNEWIPEIKAKNIKMFSIDFSEEYFVKKTATFFRIPQKGFIEGDKLLLREIISKNGLIVARSENELFFPKSVMSIILKNNYTTDKLLTVMGYLSSYICFFDIVVNGIKGNRKYFPRLSILSLKNLSFNEQLFNTDISNLVGQLIKIAGTRADKDTFDKTYALVQSRIFHHYNVSDKLALLIMNYLKAPKSMQKLVLENVK